MDARTLHPWDVTPAEAQALQRELAARVVRTGDPPESDVRLVAGCDVAFDKPNRRAVGAVVVLDYPSLALVTQAVAETPVTFPYVPGLLSFRETPVLLEAFAQLERPPDLLLVDGHGYAHPRRFGYACHLGLLLDLPTVGVAKSRLVGEHGAVGAPRGSRTNLVHENEVVGSLLRTRENVRPVYVSVGHRIALQAAERWVLRCATSYRAPEPARLADRLASEEKSRMLGVTLEVVVEQRAGEHGRWEWVKEDDEVIFRHDLDPMPAHYGCSVDLMNPADDELLDVIIVDPDIPGRGERRTVRVVDVLERTDGDHKLLAVSAAAPAPPLAGVRDEIWRWFVAHDKPVVRWAGEDGALAVIRACREATEGT
jgi:deoxyribonuclease V